MKIKNILSALLIILIFLFCISCSKTSNEKNSKKEQIIVSIPPLKWTVEKIAGNDFEVSSIVNQNMNHELFEPKPRDLVTLETSKIFFIYGTLPFEKQIMSSLSDTSKVVNVIDGIDSNLLLKSTHGEDTTEAIDPHIWFSLDIMPMIAENIKNKLIAKYPNKKDQFEANYTKFISEISAFKAKIDKDLNSKSNKSFIIYHPALNYFLKDRDLFQIEVEQDGKEPSAKYIQTIIDVARSKNIKTILVQPQFPKQSAEAISNEIKGSKVIPFNVLEENIFENLQKFVNDLN